MVEKKYCNGKRKYDKRSAITAKNARFNEAHIQLRVYECPYCGGWHLTSSVNKKGFRFRRFKHNL